MLAANLRLVRRKNCFISLPRDFLSHEPAISDNPNALLCIKPVKDNSKIYVSWDGRLNSHTDYELDTDFGIANKLSNGEAIIVDLVQLKSGPQCKYCDFIPVKQDEYSMLESKFKEIELDLLNRIRVVYEGLVLPVWLSSNVKVPVKIVTTEPKDVVALSNITEVQIIGSSDKKPNKNNSIVEKISDIELAFFDNSLGIRSKKNIHFGAMLVCGSKGSGKTHYISKVIDHYNGIFNITQNCKDLCDLKPQTIRLKLFSIAKQAIENQPAILGLDNIELIAGNDPMHEQEKGLERLKSLCIVDAICRMLKFIERYRSSDDELAKVAVIMTACSLECLHPRLASPKARRFFNKVKTIDELDEEGRTRILLSKLAASSNVRSNLSKEDVSFVARLTKSFLPLDLKLITEKAMISAISSKQCKITSQVELCVDDFVKSLENYVPVNLRNIKLQRKSSLTFANIGGMRKVKETLSRIILFPLKYPNLIRQAKIRLQTHVLLHGPPGCGKTLIAEALANEQKLNFFCVKGPELFSKYIGGSEASVRDLFERAETAAPCIILFDEFDSIAPRRGHDSTGVTDRVVNQLLTLMDGARRLKEGVHIVAATSRPDLIDPALLRPGRLDVHVYCGAPDSNDRFEILQVLSARILLHDDVDFKYWAQTLNGFTGADIHSFLYTAQLRSLHEELDKKKKKEEIDICVCRRHLDSAFESLAADVAKRFERLARLNPKVIGKLTVNQISPRATLA